jgi:chromate transport protein ChrA
MPLVLQNLVLTQVSLLSWGGGPTSLALMQSKAVRAGFTTRKEFGG